MIRKAEIKDLSRIAEILVFVKRTNYRSIFHNDDFSFNNLQVLKVAEEYEKPEILEHIWVYDDCFVKGMIHIEEKEIVELYVDVFFQNEGIGGELVEFAKREFDADHLWALEKNTNAIRFYEAHVFHVTGIRKPEANSSEYLVKLVR